MYEGDIMKSRAPQPFVRFAAMAALGIGLVACAQGTGEPPVETEQPTESVQAGDPAAPAPAVAKRGDGARRDPHQMIEKLDLDKNGTLELDELPAHKREFFESLDTDKNGSLSAAELEAHKQKMGERMFALKDANKDGVLTEAELGERWSKLSAADADQDGKITRAELEAAHRDGKLVPFHGGHGKRGMFGKDPQKMIERFDANKNGTLELAELPEHKRQWLGAADTDKNGSLSVAELEAHEQKRGEHMFAMQDQNKDGFLTEAEVGQRHWSRLSVADADKDGKVSKTELEAAHRDGKLVPFGGKHHGFRKHGARNPQAL
jgi:Ca2+-binding EF-hand superfamily protein